MLTSFEDEPHLAEASGPDAIGQGTSLYGLTPIGSGTSARESLRGYLVRLALEHSVRPRDLVSKVLAADEPAISKLDYASFYSRHAATLDGLGTYARLFVRALQAGTGRRDLAQHTLLPLSTLLAPNGQRLLAKAPRWCPECLAADTTGHGGGHWQLRWTLVALTHCSDHGRPLHSLCPQCNKAQPVIPRKSNLWHCDHCGASLGSGLVPEPGSKQPVPRSTDIIGDLIEFGDGNVPDAGQAWLAGIERALYATDEGTRAALCRSLGLQPRALNGWIKKGQKVSLDLLISVCDGLGALPSEVIAGEQLKVRDLPSVRMTGSRKRHSNQKRLYVKALLIAAVASERQSTLRELSTGAGVSRSYLRYWFPGLCDEIATKRAIGLASIRLRRNRWRAEVLRQAVHELLLAGVFPGRKRLEGVARRAGFSLVDSGVLAAYHCALTSP